MAASTELLPAARTTGGAEGVVLPPGGEWQGPAVLGVPGGVVDEKPGGPKEELQADGAEVDDAVFAPGCIIDDDEAALGGKPCACLPRPTALLWGCTVAGMWQEFDFLGWGVAEMDVGGVSLSSEAAVRRGGGVEARPGQAVCLWTAVGGTEELRERRSGTAFSSSSPLGGMTEGTRASMTRAVDGAAGGGVAVPPPASLPSLAATPAVETAAAACASPAPPLPVPAPAELGCRARLLPATAAMAPTALEPDAGGPSLGSQPCAGACGASAGEIELVVSCKGRSSWRCEEECDGVCSPRLTCSINASVPSLLMRDTMWRPTLLRLVSHDLDSTCWRRPGTEVFVSRRGASAANLAVPGDDLAVASSSVTSLSPSTLPATALLPPRTTTTPAGEAIGMSSCGRPAQLDASGGTPGCCGPGLEVCAGEGGFELCDLCESSAKRSSESSWTAGSAPEELEERIPMDLSDLDEPMTGRERSE